MAIQRVCICAVQVPFARGGAEMLVDSLAGALRARGLAVDVVSLPFKWYPSAQVITHALTWRLLDLTEAQGTPIDLVIATKFPSYLVRHPRKVTWLFHQFRQAYELEGTAYAELGDTWEERRIRSLVREMDSRMLPESRHVFTIARNVSDRLSWYNGLESIPLYPPPPLGDAYRCDGYGDFVLSVGRLERIKRVDLLFRALKLSKHPLRCIVVGTGPEEKTLRALADGLGMRKQVEFAGFVPDEKLLDLYARCRAVYYAPFDEDYGLVTLEALRSRKPVVTAADSGGVLEFITDGETGLVTPPDAVRMAGALDRVAEDPDLCERLGRAGRDRVKGISWDSVIDRLLAAAS